MIAWFETVFRHPGWKLSALALRIVLCLAGLSVACLTALSYERPFGWLWDRQNLQVLYVADGWVQWFDASSHGPLGNPNEPVKRLGPDYRENMTPTPDSHFDRDADIWRVDRHLCRRYSGVYLSEVNLSLIWSCLGLFSGAFALPVLRAGLNVVAKYQCR